MFCHRIVLVRHGETTTNAATDRLGEIPEHMYAHLHQPSLTDKGLEQAKHIADVVSQAPWPIDQIEVSPLLRAAETAYPTIDMIGNTVPIMIEPDLCEFFRACSKHVSHTERVPDRLQQLARTKMNDWTRAPESIYDFEARISRLLARWTLHTSSGPQPRTTIVFTHSHVINSLLRRAIGLPPDVNGGKFRIDNGSFSVLDIMPDGSFIINMTNSTT